MVCRGWTVHVVTNHDGRPIRPPGWFTELLDTGKTPGRVENRPRGTRLGRSFQPSAFSRQEPAASVRGEFQQPFDN